MNKELKILAGFIHLFLILFGVTATISAVSPLKESSSYSISIDESNPRLLKVKSEFTALDDELYMSRYGANQFPDRWAKFVRNMKAVDKRARVLKVTDLGGAKWKIAATKGLRVTLTYEIVLDHEKHEWSGGIDGVAFAKDWGVFYTGRSFLIMNGNERKGIELSFELPDGWHISGSWNQVKPGKFIAANLTDLSESMFFAGTHKEFSIKRDGFELLFALGGKGIVDKQNEYRNLAQGVLDYYIDLMGGIPSSQPGADFKKAIVIINSGEQVDGEVIGNHINMIFDPNGDAQSQIMATFIFAHEFFHLWNGKSIHAADTSEEWFKEGVTSYYTLKALNQVGSINEETYFAILNNLFYQKYSKDEAYGKSSMRDLADGFNKGKHWGLIYGGGLFVGLCQDIEIRKNTGNKKSLDDLMVDYFENLGGTSKTYTTEDLQKSMTDLSGKSQANFFNQYVFGAKPIPITDCLSDAGLNASVAGGQLKVSKNPDASMAQKEILKGIMVQQNR